MNAPELATIAFFTFVLPVSWMFASAYFKRWNRRIEQEGQLPPDIQAEMEQLRNRVLELEERVDFTERLLARTREPEQLPGER